MLELVTNILNKIDNIEICLIAIVISLLCIILFKRTDHTFYINMARKTLEDMNQNLREINEKLDNLKK